MKILKAVIVLGTMYPTAFFANAADAGGGAAGDDVIQEEEQHVTTTSSSSTTIISIVSIDDSNHVNKSNIYSI